MILSTKIVLELCKKINLIENLSERELTNPEGVGIDFRVGEVYRLTSPGFLGVETRKTPDITKIGDVKNGPGRIILAPGEYVLVKTMEKINQPPGKVVIEEGREPAILMADIYPRGTLHRSGIIFRASKSDPGYSGEMTFGLYNASSFPFEIELGARFANVVFHEVVGDLARAYEGQWQGGRVTTDGHEKQV